MMNSALSKGLVAKILVFCCLVSLAQSMVVAQPANEPEKTTLLNGLRIVFLPKPGDQEVFLKLRVHSGAAFDLEGKAGTAALLGDLLFPDPTTREYFAEENQGQLLVTTDYDGLEITMRGQAREFERIVEILRNALVTTDLRPETITRIRDGRIKIIRETSVSPATVADRAVAARLFGDFPYGRPAIGSPESLERIQRADLMLARERFLNPNNATLVIIGGVQRARVMRTLRQLLGGWRKSEQIVPSTFRQPTPPDGRTLIVNGPNDQSVEVRLAVRGLARSDRDVAAATVLAGVARQRWEKQVPDLSRSPVFVRHDAHTLPGLFVMGTSIDPLLSGKALATAQEVVRSLMTSPPSAVELEQTRAELLMEQQKDAKQREILAESWLDMDTYGLTADQLRSVSSITADDVQRVANRLFRDGSFASVVVGDAELVRAPLEKYGKVEVMGSVAPPPTPAAKSTPNHPQSNTGSKP